MNCQSYKAFSLGWVIGSVHEIFALRELHFNEIRRLTARIIITLVLRQTLTSIYSCTILMLRDKNTWWPNRVPSKIIL